MAARKEPGTGVTLSPLSTVVTTVNVLASSGLVAKQNAIMMRLRRSFIRRIRATFRRL